MLITLDPLGQTQIEVDNRFVAHWYEVGKAAPDNLPLMTVQEIERLFERRWQQFQIDTNRADIQRAFDGFDVSHGVNWLDNPQQSAFYQFGLVNDAEHKAARIGFMRGFYETMPVFEVTIQRAEIERAASISKNEFGEEQATALVRLKQTIAGQNGALALMLMKTSGDWQLLPSSFIPDYGSGVMVAPDQIKLEMI